MEAERIARNLLFAGVASVLALASERPARGSSAIDAEAVLAQVPPRQSAEGRALAALERDPASKLELARAYIEASRRDGDPRYLGLAEGALVGDASVEGRVLRATILQSRHAFPEALVELEGALREGANEQAQLTQATVFTVQAEYERARASCRALPPSIYRVACEASVDALTGEAQRAQKALQDALPRAPFEGAWLHSLLGELAYWQGDDARAERELTGLTDRYSHALLSDLRLDRGAPADGDDLHLALTELAQGAPGAAVERVQASFADSDARGDRVHLREQARFWLARGERARALRMARENWQVQREPWDARILIEAAATRAEAAPALAWLEAARLPRLQALAARLEAP
jgi:hypothetical protein